MTPVRVEQLYTDTILGSKDWSVDHMGDLTREVWFGLVGCQVGGVADLRGFLDLEVGVEP